MNVNKLATGLLSYKTAALGSVPCDPNGSTYSERSSREANLERCDETAMKEIFMQHKSTILILALMIGLLLNVFCFDTKNAFAQTVNNRGPYCTDGTPITITNPLFGEITIHPDPIAGLVCGAGESLGCSVPEFASLAGTPEYYKSKFDPACVRHDLCYRHGEATYGLTRRQCDDEFRSKMYGICSNIELIDIITFGASMAICNGHAQVFYEAVRDQGASRFRTGTDSTFCPYDRKRGQLTLITNTSNGDGSWEKRVHRFSDGPGVHQYPTLIGDVNGDGKSDFIFVFQHWDAKGGLTLRTRLSNAQGTWDQEIEQRFPADLPRVHQHPTLIGDVDGDGRSDLIFVYQHWDAQGGLTLNTKLSNGNGTWKSFENRLPDGGGVHKYPTLIGDIDGDGRDDLIFVFQHWDSQGGLILRTKLSRFTHTEINLGLLFGRRPIVIPQWAAFEQRFGDGKGIHKYPTLIGDVDGDGRSDLVFVFQHWDAQGGLTLRTKLSEFKRTGDGDKMATTHWSTFEQRFGDGRGIHQYPPLIGDVDGDGKSDILFAFEHSSDNIGLTIRTKLSAFKRSQDNDTQMVSARWDTFESAFLDGSGVHQCPTLIGDIDNDGKSDLIFVFQHWDASGGLVLRTKKSAFTRNSENGSITTTEWIPFEERFGEKLYIHQYPTLVGDLNNDGKSDLVFVFDR